MDGYVSSLLKDMVGQGKVLWWEGFWSGPYMVSGEAGGRRGPLDLLATRDHKLENEACDG